MSMPNSKLVIMTKEIVESAFSRAGSSESANVILGNPDYVTEFMQAVYDKLKELDKED